MTEEANTAERRQSVSDVVKAEKGAVHGQDR